MQNIYKSAIKFILTQRKAARDRSVTIKQLLNTVHPPICHAPIYPQNPIYPHFFGHENGTNRVRGGFQKTKFVNL